MYASVLVRDICGVVVDNVDGTVAVSPGQEGKARGAKGEHGQQEEEEGLQLVRFSVLDCYARKFMHYNFKGVEYRVSTADTNVASAYIYSSN